MAQMNKVGKHKTKVFEDDGDLVCKYHNTEVCRLGWGRLVLRSGGYRTSTTKVRINQFCNEHNLPYKVYQRSGVWYLDTPSGDLLFQDGIELPAIIRREVYAD